MLLDLVVHEFQRGASPEEIVDSYDALSLPDVYAVRSYYMQQPGADRRVCDAARRRSRRRPPQDRGRSATAPEPATMLLARLTAKENRNAPPAQRP